MQIIISNNSKQISCYDFIEDEINCNIVHFRQKRNKFYLKENKEN